VQQVVEGFLDLLEHLREVVEGDPDLNVEEGDVGGVLADGCEDHGLLGAIR